MGTLDMIRSKLANPKQKTVKCRICPTRFEKKSMAHIVCSHPCVLELAERKRLKDAAKREQEERAAHRVKKLAAKKHGEWESDLQKLVNKFARLRDASLPCISCGTYKTVQWEAGHYIAVGANNTLRFVLDNIHKQCHRCNVQLSSNAIMYRVALVKKIGVERVEWLEGPHETNKISIPELQAEIARYKGLIKLADKEVA